MKKANWITLIVIIAVIILAIFIMSKPSVKAKDEIVKCIGENSVLYVQVGCHACETQEEMFGENIDYINIVDCFYERDNCNEITATPTWIIKNEKYVGVQSIAKLQELTGCD